MNARAALPIFAATLLAASAGSSSEQAPGDWTQFRLNAANNAAVAGTLRASWTIRTGGGFSSSPTTDSVTLYAGNNAGVIYAIDVASGRLRWTRRLHNPVMSAPLLFGTSVIVTEGNENSPTQATPSQPIHVGYGANAIVALDRRTGSVLWSRNLEGTGMPTPAIVGGVLVHHDGAGIALGLDPRSGAVRFERALHSIASMSAALPIGTDRWVTAGESSNTVWELRAADGAIVWQSSLSPGATGVGDCPPASDGSRVYCDYVVPPSAATTVVVGEGAHERVYAIDIATGKRAWDVEIDAGSVPPRNESAIPLLAGGKLFVGSSMEPRFNAVDPHTGRLLWRTTTHGAVLGCAAYATGRVYFGDLGGYVWALDARNGRVLGTYDARAPFNVGSSIIVGQTLVIGSRGGTLFAIPLSTIAASHARL